MTDMNTHYVIGINLGESSMPELLQSKKDGNGERFLLSKDDTTSPFAKIKTVRFGKLENAQKLIEILNNGTDTTRKLDPNLAEFVELLEPLPSTTKVNQSSLLDYTP